MKRLAIIVIALLVLAGIFLAVAPSIFANDLTRERITEQIAAWIGRPVQVTGEPEIRFFPQPSVTLEGVTIEDGSGRPFITTERLTASVRVLPLLVGRVEIAEFVFDEPMIALRVDATGAMNWAPLGEVGARVAAEAALPAAAPDEVVDAAPDPRTATPPAPVDEVRLGRFIIRNGTITYEEAGAPPVVIGDVTLDIIWPATSEPAIANGSLVWLGQKVDLTAELDAPLNLIAGRASTGRFSLAAAPIRAAFDGIVTRTGLDFAFDGAASAEIASLRNTIRWIGTPMDESPTLGRAGFEGTVRWAWPTLAFTGATFTLDGNEAEGSFIANFAGPRPRIDGTLAFEELDLSIYAETFRTDVAASGDNWRLAAIDLPALQAVDFDIRISAETMTIVRTELEDLAASAVANGGRVAINVGRAELYGGLLQGTVTAEVAAPDFAIAARFALSDAATLPALAATTGVSIISGVGSASLDVRGAGANWGEVVATLSGTLEASIDDGTVRGIDFAAAASSDDPLVAALLVGGGATAFGHAESAMHFEGGRLMTDRFVADGPAFVLDFGGWGSLLGPAVGGSGTVVLRPAAGQPVTVPFLVSGTWREPVFAPDPDGAAPMLPAPGPLPTP